METEAQARGPEGHPRPSSQQVLLQPSCPQESGLMGAQYYSLPRPRIPDLQNSIQGWEGPPGQRLYP